LVGGSSTPGSLIDECVRLNLPIAPTYGLTETASQVATLLPQEVATRRGSSGLPLPTTQVRVVNSSGHNSGNEVGEIEVRGPTVFAGYLDEPPTGLGTDQWFRTGDVGFLDEDGFLHVIDRRSDLIVSGGENIYPAEVERALLEHENVLDAGVASVASDEWGTRPAAAVVWGGESSFSEPLLREFLRQRLAAYKVPDRIVALEAIPRSPSGKLLRRELRGLLSANAADS
jgi:O-succinylbenzoic acid--CoA ligase